ncbi:Cytochrome P450 72A15 [Morella rubra]|uniref:Cytochrome P450 72A15 n=1 Tax=Morella rubra TaxID=262757 RepID=A0A6A1V9W1_9ROSI|nr:Cytochrome P450 72A15 [Morella rubra]
MLSLCDFSLYSLALPSMFLLLYGVGRVSYSIWWKPKSLERGIQRQGIRGTPYKPMIGDMKELVRAIIEAWSKPIYLTHQIVPRVDLFTLDIVQKYGKISMFWAGTTPRLIIMEPEQMKEVLSNKLGHFQKPPLNPLILILTKGLTTLEGEQWAKHRKIVNPAFHQERLKLTADAISRAAFGSSYEEGKRIFELQTELIMLTLEAMQTLYILGFRFVPTKKNRRRTELDKEIKSTIRNLIQRKLNAKRIEESSVDDLLGLLLQSNTQNNQPEDATSTKSNSLSIDEVIEECKQFYLAGQETTSSWLTWTMVVLAIHQDWQEKAREEVLLVCGKRNPNFEAITHLKIVSDILNPTTYILTSMRSPMQSHNTINCDGLNSHT